MVFPTAGDYKYGLHPILKRVIDKLAKAAIVGDGYALEKELVEANQQEFEFLKHVLVVAPVE